MKLNLNIDIDEKKENEKKEDLETRLRRLAATFEGTCAPIGDMQKLFYNTRTTPYTDMAPETAFLQFKNLIIEYQKTIRLGCAVNVLREKSSVSVAPTYVKVNDIKPFENDPQFKDLKKKEGVIPIIEGDLQNSHSVDEKMARTVANVLTLYTSAEDLTVTTSAGETTRHIVTPLTSKQQGDALLYKLDVEQTRKIIQVAGPSNGVTRDKMYSGLTAPLRGGDDNEKNKGRAVIYYLMNRIASTNKPFAKKMPAPLVDIYNKYRPDKTPIEKEMYWFNYESFLTVKKSKEPDECWRIFLKARQFTGSTKEFILSGYSLMDMMPGQQKKVEEAMDIVTCARTHGYLAVRMMQADLTIADLLLASGLSVYCTTYGRGLQTTTTIGIYNNGNAKVMNWYSALQKTPELKADKIEYPPSLELYEHDTFAYAYLPRQAENDVRYLPSIRAAAGLVIKTNNFSVRFTCTLPELTNRFYSAMMTRGQYLFTRVTFPMIDPMSKYFMYPVVLPKTTKEGEKDETSFEELLQGAEVVTFKKDLLEAWENNGARVAPYLSVVEHRSIIDPKSVAQSGAKFSLADVMKTLTTKLQSLKSNPEVYRDIFYNYAVHGTVRVEEIRPFITGLDKKKCLDLMVQVGGLKGVKIDDLGVCQFTFSHKHWKRYKLTHAPPNVVVQPTTEPPPPNIDPEEEDPYAEAAPVSFVTQADE